MDEDQLSFGAIHLAEVDGVPVVWSETGGDPTAVLSFRVGQADETLTTRGLTHLAEHLALARFSDALFPLNGSTGLSATRFVAATPADRLASFVTGVSSQIGRLASDDSSTANCEIRHEAKILKAESAARGGNVVSAALTDLYGAHGLGLGSYDELALFELDPEALRQWVSNRFTRRNAVLMLTVPPPAGLDLSNLPDGERHGPISVTPLLDQLPGHRRRPGPMAMVAPVVRGVGVAAMAGILERALMTRLRHESGSSYSPSVQYDALSGDDGLIIAVADAAPGHGSAVVHGALEELQRLATRGPMPDEMISHREFVTMARRSDAHRRAHLSYAANEVLFGSTPLTEDGLFGRVLAVDSEEIREAAQAVASSMVMSVPPDASVPDHVPALEWPSEPLLDGQTVLARRRSNETVLPVLVLAREGLSFVDGSRRLTIRSDEVVGLLRWDDGFEELVGRPALSFRMVPGRWSEEERVRRHLSDMARGRTVRMGFRFAAPPTDPAPSSLSWIHPMFLWILTPLVVLFTAGSVVEGDSASAATWSMILAAVVAGGLVATWFVLRWIDGQHVYDDVDWHLQSDQWQPQQPLARAFIPGSLRLAWLAENHLLADWVERGAVEALAAYRSGLSDATELYQELGGVLASDMCVPEARRFFNWLHLSRTLTGQRLIDAWWNDLGLGSDPYAVDLDDSLVALSNYWINRVARRTFRADLPLLAWRLESARGEPTPLRGALKGRPATPE